MTPRVVSSSSKDTLCLGTAAGKASGLQWRDLALGVEKTEGEFGRWKEWGKEVLATSCEREQWLLCPWSRVGYVAQGPAHRVWWWREGGLGGHYSHRVRPSDCFFFFSYIGSRVTSNMVIVEVSLLSGFVLAPRSRMLVRTLE